jgi:hypothetical protein
VLAVLPENMVVGGRAAVFFQKKAIEGEVELKDPKMVEVLLHALDREYLLHEGLAPDGVGSMGERSRITPGGIDLTEPSRVSITGGTNSYEGM